jgi:alpha-tubulin suppressor-like RCC1 family protein
LKDPLTLPNTRKLAVGNVHACAVSGGGSLSCWGANESGQAAPSSKLGIVGPTSSILSEVIDVAVGLRHTCAVTRDRGVVCFGDNHLGQLGSAQPLSDATVPISGITPTATAIAAGLTVSCALTAAGTVFCWGNLDGQAAPQAAYQVSGLPSSVIQLAAGGDRVCALLADRRVACWKGYRAPPKLVPETEGSVEVAVGDEHACARDARGRVRCWGSNDFGQLGVEVRVNRTEITPPHSCPQVSYQIIPSWDEAQEVGF